MDLDADFLRPVLVALNGSWLARPLVCRLAASPAEWLGPVTARQAAAAVGVPLAAIEEARRLAGEARPAAAAEAEAAGRLGGRLVTLLDDEYPAPLRDLALPPPVLTVRGRLEPGPAVAIVGSRHPDPYGREASRFFAEELARGGVTVISGFARGVDAAAHGGAVDGGGRTVAVLGCGLDVDYPRGQRRLADEVAASGAVISEWPLGTQPRSLHFPIRNRLIAALGQATLVIQATPRSGSLITARLALDLGREVFALPGRIFDERSLGPNALLRDGARLALHPGDLVAEVAPGGVGEPEAEAAPPLRELPGRVWAALRRGKPRSPEALAGELAIGVDQVLGTLLELELGGWAERFPGPVYCRRRARM